MSGIVQRPRDDTHHRHGMALHKWAGILLLLLLLLLLNSALLISH